MPRQKQQQLKKRKDGRYCKVVYGKQFLDKDDKVVLAKAKAYKDAVDRGDFVEDVRKKTVFSYAFQWLPVHKASVSKNTYNSYVNYMNKLVNKIGKKPMKDVTPSDIKDVYNQFIGQSESSIRKARMLYVDMWDSAIKDKIVRENPVREATPHKGHSGTHRALTEKEDELILSCPADLRLAVLLMRYAGLRRGEAMAFDIDKDVDQEAMTISVSRAIAFVGNKGEETNPKTEAGTRTIPLLDILSEEFKDKHGPVCPMKKVKIMTTSSWRSMWDHYKLQLEAYLNGCPQRRWFHRTKAWIKDHPDEWQKYQDLMKEDPAEAEKYRLRDWIPVTIRPHDLRHSYCTMLRDIGVDIKLAIAWMGHADEKMILRIYDHPPKQRIDAAIKTLNQGVLNMQNDMQDKSLNRVSIDNTEFRDDYIC